MKGASIGAAVALAVASAISRRPVGRNVGVTGQVSQCTVPMGESRLTSDHLSYGVDVAVGR